MMPAVVVEGPGYLPPIYFNFVIKMVGRWHASGWIASPGLAMTTEAANGHE